MDALRCPICDAPQYSCGPPYAGEPIDFPFPRKPREAHPMALKEYDVVMNGQPTTAQLTEAQAKRLGATETGRSIKLAGPAAPVDPDPPGGTKAAAGRTKARRPANKAADG